MIGFSIALIRLSSGVSIARIVDHELDQTFMLEVYDACVIYASVVPYALSDPSASDSPSAEARIKFLPIFMTLMTSGPLILWRSL